MVKPIHQNKIVVSGKALSDQAPVSAEANKNVESTDQSAVRSMSAARSKFAKSSDKPEVLAYKEKVFTKTLTFEPGQHLKIDQKVGDIVIRSGQGSKITVVATKKTKESVKRLEEMKLVIEVRPEGAYIMTDWQESLIPTIRSDKDRDKVDFVITLPRKANIKINVGVGRVDIDNIEGNISVNTGAGQIALKYPAEAEKRVCRLQTQVGGVNLDLTEKISSYINATCDVGKITSDIPRINPSYASYGAGDRGIFQIGNEAVRNKFDIRTAVGDINIRVLHK